MELNSYQQQVLSDLEKYLECVGECGDLQAAWEKYWQDRGEKPNYNNEIAGVPRVCVKVPTGGGKTFLACASVKQIFRRLLLGNPKLVIWLVPSDAILTQTIDNLSRADHPYRQRLNKDFDERVEICTKEMLLQGQNFSPVTVAENLTICVMSYAALRIDSHKKDIRKVYYENGALMNFASQLNDRELLLEDTPETALINILRKMTPLVIVDESHNAGSNLSAEMLKNLQPSFILELTATPKNSSNVISHVDARALKAEHMIKLPVVVFKKDSREEVITGAIDFQKQIEAQAVEIAKRGGKYIRPIVLFQAQPNTGEDSATFEKIKNSLVTDFKIPADQIAIKTSTINDLKNVDLLSEKSPIRYIITVNALKEGWDCPFAYILASLANKNSSVEVEQIVGRILRQPYAENHNGALLNLSAVFTSSDDFHATLEKITVGLKVAGFTGNEYRVADSAEPAPEFEQSPINIAPEFEQSPINIASNFEADAADLADVAAENPVNENPGAENYSDDAAEAERQAGIFESDFNNQSNVQIGNNEPVFEIRAEFRESVADLKIPQFVHKIFPANILSEDVALLDKSDLIDGFNLSQQDANIDFSAEPDDIHKIDIYERGDAIPFHARLNAIERQNLVRYLDTLPDARKIYQLIVAIAEIINPHANISKIEIQNYVRRALGNIDTGEFDALKSQVYFYAIHIKQKIDSLLKIHRKKKFKNWLDTGEILCQKFYAPPEKISLQSAVDSIPKSLYRAEMSNMNNFELRMADELASAENVKWWHRIIDRRGFRLNGYINHYPDFLVMTHSGKIILVETKGGHLDGDDSAEKISLGRDWQNRSGENYLYCMVFESKEIDGAYNLNKFLGVLRSF